MSESIPSIEYMEEVARSLDMFKEVRELVETLSPLSIAVQQNIEIVKVSYNTAVQENIPIIIIEKTATAFSKQLVSIITQIQALYEEHKSRIEMLQLTTLLAETHSEMIEEAEAEAQREAELAALSGE